jgi:hypothetical protein
MSIGFERSAAAQAAIPAEAALGRCCFHGLAKGRWRALSVIVSSSYNTTDGCADCARLLSKYEAITFEQARILNALATAFVIGDRIAIRRRKLEAYDVTARQRAACEALRGHQDLDHTSAHTVEMGSASSAASSSA